MLIYTFDMTFDTSVLDCFKDTLSPGPTPLATSCDEGRSLLCILLSNDLGQRDASDIPIWLPPGLSHVP